MSVRTIYKIRKEKEQLERKLDRLVDFEKIKVTMVRIKELEREELDRLAHWGGKQ